MVWWVAAEQPWLIGEQIAGLAAEMGCAEPGTPMEVARRAVLRALHGRRGWLLSSIMPSARRTWRGGCQVGRGTC